MCKFGYLAVIGFGAIVLAACDTDDSDSTPSGDEPVARVLGTVYNAVNSQPIRDAIISTLPPTQEVSTGIDGKYDFFVPSGAGGRYEVFADHIAYRKQQKTVTVLDGETATADFPLQSNASGLVASPTVLSLSESLMSDTIRLSSNVPNTGFSVLVADPWIRVSPASGVITSGETLFLEFSVDPTLIPARDNADTEVVINADNGLSGVFVNVLVDTGRADYVNGVNTARQADCRRPDIFRIALSRPDANLVQFASSVNLDSDVLITRDYGVTFNPFLVDSIVIPELGIATVEHVANGPENTVMELFELTLDEQEVISIIGDGDFDIDGGRAGVDIALLPGVYCLYIAPTTGEFTAGTELTLEYRFRLEQ